MKILMTGGTGFIGGHLSRALIERKHQVAIATRRPERQSASNDNIRYVLLREDMTDEVDGTDVVINLAGESLYGKRWTNRVKKSLYDSRIQTTRSLVSAMAQSKQKPGLFLSGSAVGYYGDCGDEQVTEERGPGDDFLAEICRDWEAEAQKASSLGIRVVTPRVGVVLGTDGGALSVMLPVFKSFIGGSIGSGSQYFPWIHIADISRAIVYAIENESVKGPFNAVAPNPVTMDFFAKTLGDVLSRPSLFKVPEFGLKAVLGEASVMITASLNVIPKKISDQGFTFQFPELRPALEDLLN